MSVRPPPAAVKHSTQSQTRKRSGRKPGLERWVVAAGVAAVLLGCQPPSVERVVLVSIDTLRADYVGAYGGVYPTPNLDAIAASGVRFETAISPTPITLPSHTSLLTGLEPPRHGVRNNTIFRLSDGVPTLAEKMRDAGFATAAFVGAMVLDRQYGLARGFDAYDDRMPPRLAAGDDGFPERTADAVVDAALEWIDSAPPRFFLWLHLYDPHSGYNAPPLIRRSIPRSPYAAEIAFVDREIGRFLGKLEERGDDRETLVVVTSDHGESLREHGEVTHSLTVYDATQRVPLLMRGPGLPEGEVVAVPARLVDVAPTILALVGAPPLADVDGRDLGPVIAGKTKGAPTAYVETLATQLDLGWSPLLGVRSKDFKYIRAPRPELYDLKSDPGELRNLHTERPGESAKLDQELSKILARGEAVVPNVSPDPEAQAMLESLGYAIVTPRGGARFGLGRVGGVDPKDGLANVNTLFEAWHRAAKDPSADSLAMLASIEGGGYVRTLVGADIALTAGDLEAAERFARDSVRNAPGFWESHTTLGRALEAQGRLDEAEEAYRAAATLDAAAANPFVGLGRVAEARGDRERAQALYERARERRGNSPEAVWRLAALQMEAGDDDTAAKLLRSIPAETLLEPKAAVRLAKADSNRGRPEQARERLDAARAQNPNHAMLKEVPGESAVPSSDSERDAAP